MYQIAGNRRFTPILPFFDESQQDRATFLRPPGKQSVNAAQSSSRLIEKIISPWY